MAEPPVAFDVTPMAGFRTGIGLAVAELYDALTRLPHGSPLIPFALGLRIRKAAGTLPDDTRVVRFPTRGLLLAWARAEHPRIDRFLGPPRVIHATNFVAPPSRLPTLVTVHDCTFARFPEAVSPVVRQFGPILRRAVDRGAWLHCTTETIARELEELFGPGLRDGGKLVVVPFGIPRLGPPGSLPPALREGLGKAPYVLALGTLEPRKNLPRLVKAFGGVASGHPDLRLVLVGPDGMDRPAVDVAVHSLEPSLRGRVLLADAVDEGARRTLIEGAAILAYPSIYEGFGFPMLEAMSLGVPVVAGRAGALPEVAANAAELVDPLDPDAIGAGLEAVLTNDALRRELVSRGRARAGEFTWSRTARGIRDAYRALAGSDIRT